MSNILEKSEAVHLSKSRYKERVVLIKYSLTFSAAAAAFLVSLTTKESAVLQLGDIKVTLLFWGITIVSGFLQYVFSYREVYYHTNLPNGIRQQLIPRIELIILYIMMYLHAIGMLIAIVMTITSFWLVPPRMTKTSNPPASSGPSTSRNTKLKGCAAGCWLVQAKGVLEGILDSPEKAGIQSGNDYFSIRSASLKF